MLSLGCCIASSRGVIISRVFLAILVCLLAGVMQPSDCLSDDNVDVKKAAHIKAAYLYHLARLSEWPTEKLSADSDTLFICVVGEDPHDLAGFFSAQTPNLRAGKYQLKIKHFSNSSDIMDLRLKAVPGYPSCHLMFFTESEGHDFKDCLDFAHGHSILTASEIDNFLNDGGMVGFVVDGDRVRIQVNQQAVSRASLKISAEFLQHVEIIAILDEPGGDG